MAFKSKWWEKWLARAFHVLLTSGVVTVVFIKETDLRKSIESDKPVYAACFLSLLSAATICYFLASLIDPGYVSTKSSNVNIEDGLICQGKEIASAVQSVDSNDEKDEETETTRMMLAEGNALKLRHCGYCEILQPLRSKHCEECGHCIRKYDHHCPWLATCIGEKNHRFFWAFLLLETAVVCWVINIVWNAFKSKSTSNEWLKANWLLLCVMIFVVLILIVVGLLFACHSYMMLTAQTTWEFMSRSRISYLKYFPDDENPFDQGYFKNSMVFLCYCKPRTWEKLIKEKIHWR
ncbi:palmitoyltransferase ZDHHC12-B-like [Rhopilema esculentum]|uniref:palmitoyltransferase ZDHHC12-B-like n=1 Tax=Rhopilema esculentum TaxID=499914 RepID=UPI0031D59A81